MKALELIEALETLTLVSKEELKEAFKEYGYETITLHLSKALSNIEDLEEEGLVDIYYEALEEEGHSI